MKIYMFCYDLFYDSISDMNSANNISLVFMFGHKNQNNMNISEHQSLKTNIE